jgi:hypothetical protein
MKIKITESDKPVIEWIDEMAKYFKRSRSQQIMWLLGRLKVVQQGSYGVLVAQAEIFNGTKTPKTA